MWALLLSLITKIPALFTPLGPILTAINFASVGNAIKNAFNSVIKNWKFYLPAFLVILQFGTAFGWYHEHAQLVKEKAAHMKDINDFKNAQALANAKADAERSVLQKEAKANADQADAKYTGLFAEYRNNLMRYKASQSGTSGPSNHQLSSTDSRNGPSTGSEVPTTSTLNITMDDAQICAINTARLQAVHEWAINPPKDGVTK